MSLFRVKYNAPVVSTIELVTDKDLSDEMVVDTSGKAETQTSLLQVRI